MKFTRKKITKLFNIFDLLYIFIILLYLYFYFLYGLLLLKIPIFIIWYPIVKIVLLIILQYWKIKIKKEHYIITVLQLIFIIFLPNHLEIIPSPNFFLEEPYRNLANIRKFEENYKKKYGVYYYGEITNHIYKKGMHTILFNREKYEKLGVPLSLQSKLLGHPVEEYQISFFKFLFFPNRIKSYPVEYHYIVKKQDNSYLIYADIVYSGFSGIFTLSGIGNEGIQIKLK